MSGTMREYRGPRIVVRYEPRRCIHFGECVRSLPRAFDPERRPWVDPSAAPADEVAAVVVRCPTGALTFERADGGSGESPPATNTARPERDGPLYLHGRLEVIGPDGAVICRDNRVALCRCGASRNKPFCDGSHSEAGFRDPGEVIPTAAEGEGTGAVRLTVVPDGPVLLDGPCEVRSADGSTVLKAISGAFCRCGASETKPFCDGSHERIAR